MLCDNFFESEVEYLSMPLVILCIYVQSSHQIFNHIMCRGGGIYEDSVGTNCFLLFMSLLISDPVHSNPKFASDVQPYLEGHGALPNLICRGSGIYENLVGTNRFHLLMPLVIRYIQVQSSHQMFNHI